MGKSAIKYVIQRADGQFYYRKNVSSAWGFTEDFNKASLFETEKGAKSRLDIAGEGAVIREVGVFLFPMDSVYIPSCWREEDIKKYPSKFSWASSKEDGTYEFGERYYDEDMNEISKEKYEELIKNGPGI